MKAIHFIIYILARLIKTCLWWTAISKFSRWRTKKDYIDRDIKLISWVAFIGVVWFIFGAITASVTTVVFMFIFFIFVIAVDLVKSNNFRK